MEKIIEIEGKQLKVACNAFMPILYKRRFGTDFFADMFKMSDLEINAGSFDIEIIYQIIWCMARLADKNLPLMDEWLMTFDTFPIENIAPDIIELLEKTFKTSKKAQTMQTESR